VKEPEDVGEPTAGERLSRRGHDDVDAAALKDRLAEELRDIDAAEERWILLRLRLTPEDEGSHYATASLEEARDPDRDSR